MSKLVAIEGIDGAGKTTLRLQLEKLYPYHNFMATCPCEYCDLYHNFLNYDAGPTARHDHVQQAMIHLVRHLNFSKYHTRNDCEYTIADRYIASTIAYQGYGHGDEDIVKALCSTVMGGLDADVTVILDIPVPLAFTRIMEKGETPPDADYLARVRAGYLELARENNYIVIDATQSQSAVLAEFIRKTNI